MIPVKFITFKQLIPEISKKMKCGAEDSNMLSVLKDNTHMQACDLRRHCGIRTRHVTICMVETEKLKRETSTESSGMRSSKIRKIRWWLQ